MKSLFLSAVVLFSSSAFGFIFDEHKTHSFHGNGGWKNTAGDKGAYTVEMTIEPQDNGQGASFTENYQFDSGKAMSITYDVVKKGDNGFFDVFKADAKVGEGYCFVMKKHKAKACHMQAISGGDNAERTLHVDFASKQVHRMGSFDHHGSTIAWTDSVKLNLNPSVSPNKAE